MAYSINGSNGNSIVHPPVNNSLAEIADMKNYPHLRLYRAGKQSAWPNTGASMVPVPKHALASPAPREANFHSSTAACV